MSSGRTVPVPNDMVWETEEGTRISGSLLVNRLSVARAPCFRMQARGQGRALDAAQNACA